MKLEDGPLTVQEDAGDCNVIQCFKERLAGVHTAGLGGGRWIPGTRLREDVKDECQAQPGSEHCTMPSNRCRKERQSLLA